MRQIIRHSNGYGGVMCSKSLWKCDSSMLWMLDTGGLGLEASFYNETRCVDIPVEETDG